MKPKIWLTVFLILIAGFFGIWKVKQFFEIDSCLDHGGSWNYEEAYCQTEEEVATKFINEYVTYCNDFLENVTLIEWVSERTDVTKEFKEDLKKLVKEAEKRDPEIGLEFDPIFNAQDYPDEGFKLEEYDAVTGIVLVSGIRESFKLTLRLTNQDNDWLVDGAGAIRIREENRKIN